MLKDVRRFARTSRNIHPWVKFRLSPEQIASGRVIDLANPLIAMPVVNAISPTCIFVPHFRTYAELPSITGCQVSD